MIEQNKVLIKYDENSFINQPSNPLYYRIGVPYEQKSYELHNVSIAVAFLTHQTLVTWINSAPTISHHATVGTAAVKRLLSHKKTFFYNTACSQRLALGEIAAHGQPYHTLTLAFDTTSLQQLVAFNTEQGVANTLMPTVETIQSLLGGAGYETEQSGTLIWSRSERLVPDVNQFFVPISYYDAMEQQSVLQWDIEKMLPVKVTDPMGLASSLVNNYRLMRPYKVTDPNGMNHVFEFNGLGMVTRSIVQGASGEGDTIDSPTISYSYNLHNWMEHQLPVVAGVSAREVHGSANSRWLTSYTWSDGLGRELQTKVQAEDGEAFTIVIGSVVSVAQQRAASLTMLHNNTPQVIDLDTLGRPVRVTDDNGAAGSYSTYSRLDILGRITQVTDAKGRLITRHFYSIDGQPVHVHNIDSGHRWVLFNAAQKPIHQWDNRSNHIRRTYDAKQQPLEVLLQENGSTTELLTEQYSYGDASAQPYFRGRLIQSLGQEGKTTINQYDFKGNVLTLSTQVCDSYTGTINWHNSQTMGDSFTQTMTFDAMNRPTTQTAPNLQTTAFTYGKGSLLDRVSIDGSAYLTNIAYNARGQRTDVWFANGSKTRYEYDSDTFRLTRLLTTRNSGVDVLQDISYTYDPEGNIVQQSDAAQQTYYFNNSVVSPTGLYEYDALYRLIKAQGRELTNLGMATESDFVNTLSVPNAGSNAMQNYTQMFSYDELGNLQTMQSQGRWSRSYIYDNVTNRLLRHEGTNNVYTYDAHGNMTSMPHLSSMTWNSSDMLRSATNGTFTSYYSYNAAGDRVRKVVEKGNIREERLYLGNYERYRKYVNNILKTERQTVHIIDDRHRFALIDRLTIDNGITLSTATNSIRYQYDNHLGSASLELDQTAAIISYEEYHPFGTTSYRSGRTETEVSQKRYKYVGKERDEETGLYYYGARYYAAWLCRFVSVDPLQFKYPHYTPYQYAGNKPVSYIDLDGLEEVRPDQNGDQGSSYHEEITEGQVVFKNVKAAAINLNINSIEGYKKAMIEDTNEENRDSYRSKISELEAKNEKLSKEAKDIDNTIKKFIQVVVGKTMSIDLKGLGLAEDITELTIDTFKMLNEECKRQNENAKIFIIIDIKNIDSEDKVKPSGSTREIQAIGKTQRFLIDLDPHQMLKGEYGSSFANEMGDVIFKVIGPRFLPNSYKKEKEMRGFGKTARELEKMYYKFPSSIFSFGYEEGYNELISKNEKKQ